MKYILLIIGLLPLVVYGQVNETFESGIPDKWVQFPSDRWSSDTIGSLSGEFSLHHSFDNYEAGMDYIAFPINGLSPLVAETVWQFKIKYGYSPSSSNNWAFVLMSDIPPSEIPPETNMSGFVIGLNQTGYDDTLRIWKFCEGSQEIVMDCDINWQNDIGTDSIVNIKVIRDTNGDWRTYISDSDSLWTLAGSAGDQQLFPAKWAGLWYKYTSSKDLLLWADDIIVDGTWVIDTIKPEIDSCWFVSSSSVAVSFSEGIASDSLSNQSFIINPGNISPVQILIKSSRRIDLIFDEALENKTTYDLMVNRISDLNANHASAIYNDILLALPEWGDIIITEIMPDPEPEVALPACEYIELYNKSTFNFDKGTFALAYDNRTIELYGNGIQAGEQLLIINDEDSSYFSSGMNLCYSKNSITLNNNEDLIIIIDSCGRTLHGINYSKKWYKNQLKSEGGWSLEMIDYSYPFSGEENWTASRNPLGGSPALINSVAADNPDHIMPWIINVYPNSPDELWVNFSEPMGHNALDRALWGIDGFIIDSVYSTDYLMTDYVLNLAQSLEQSVLYELVLDNSIVDQSGNTLADTRYQFGLPEKATTSDIIINEILYDPLPWTKEFVEFYNRSEKIVDLNNLQIVSVNSETNDTSKAILISESRRCLIPGGYYAICEEKDAIIDAYYSCRAENIFEIASLPSLPDNGGSLILYNRELAVIDKLDYDKSMHLDILSSTEGVSLERINPDAATSNSNWQSAAATSGFATPGAQNSVYNDIPSDQSESIVFSSGKISPDNDGFEDNLLISIDGGCENNIITVMVFDDFGYPVITLAENLTSARTCMLTWNGCDKNGALVREGIYILWFRILGDDRKIRLSKKVCTVIYNH